jgi:hypothetical protein
MIRKILSQRRTLSKTYSLRERRGRRWTRRRSQSGWKNVRFSHLCVGVQYWILIRMVADRVQWFRACAEMIRWLEQVELKHAELLRTIRYFDKLSSIWLTLGSPKSGATTTSTSEALHSGAQAFARRQSSMFADMRDAAKAHWKRSADGRLRDQPECGKSSSFGDKVAIMRSDEVKWMKLLVNLYLYRCHRFS